LHKSGNAFLGYEKYDYLNKQTQNSRNGYYKRDLLTTLGNITSLAVPRDRLGEFASEFIDTYEHSTKPVDKLILELYAKGMSSRDVVDVIEKLYGKKLSPQQVSEITKEVEEERIAWEKRTLKKRYTVIFIDALFVKVRRDKVSSDAVYLVASIDDKGYRDILGMYVAGEESSTFWKEILLDLKERGVEEVLLFVFDGLLGLEEAVKQVFPKTLTQLCVVHQIRNTLSYVRSSHKQQVASDLKSIYKSKSLQQAKERLLMVKNKWEKLYPKLFNRWIDKIETLMTFLEFPEYLRPHIYSTNWLERLNKEFRKVVKTKNSFPTEPALKNAIYFKIKDISKYWDSQRLNGFVLYEAELKILWEKYYGKGGDEAVF
jgi:Transposase and inactivated derivatives